ncbi:hypothetical protein [Ekhidna sp.]|uniref:hypothetical protein n=1 Tax=Ekhidna sp. TaxID=2608089 RepID=UPI003CCC1776
MKHLSPLLLWALLVTGFGSGSLLISCSPDEVDTTCIGADTPCEGFSWSFVDPDTYENLMGKEGQPIHPDTIVILNLSQDTMYHELFSYQAIDWWTVQFIPGPYQELNCFNQCLLDSAFSRYYYIYVGNDDWDTVEVHFPANTNRATVMEVYFNDKDASVPTDRPDWTIESSYWFQKDFN